ncbi:MAG: class A beta-lactamase-related serine hydrolase [Chloroflexi bacterium CFX6]|nr:class A beta-lactamase-related serine hydrolase [Chloroflexi bacterium CFX6]
MEQRSSIPVTRPTRDWGTLDGPLGRYRPAPACRWRPGRTGRMIGKAAACGVAVVLASSWSLPVAFPAGAAFDRDGRGGPSLVAPAEGLGPSDPAEMEAFLDELMASQMAEHHIAGAAVAVVKDGKLFVAKGYGQADMAIGLPVDPERTVFRIGSTGKLLAWTAVMQLVERGKLDLNADVNTYIDFQIPHTYPQPITLGHLLAHTAGFEDLYLDFVSLAPPDPLPPGAFLATHIPARVRPPGEVPAYSNYGAALAGYIVARVSGQSYDAYIQANILDPLGMSHTSVIGVLPPASGALESIGYVFQDGTLEVFPRLYGPLDLAPIGFMGASATDMARFMIAHLQDGRYSDADIRAARILREPTTRQMHGTLFTSDPRILGTAHGFFDFSDNGQRTIGHSGTAEPMHSLLLLLPDEELGVFVAYNTLGAEALINQHLGFQRAFFDHYYPVSTVEPVRPRADFSERAGRFTGTYRMTRTAYTTLEKFRGFFGMDTIAFDDPGDGTLAMTSPWGDWHFVEVGPLLFRQVDAPFYLAFRGDDRGRITYLFTDYTPQFAFEKLRGYETPAFHMALLAGCLVVFLSMVLVLAIHAVRSRRPGCERDPSPRDARHAERIILGICTLNVLFVAGAMRWNNPTPSMGIATEFRVVLALGVVSAALTAAAWAYTARAWKAGYWGTAFRAHYTLTAVAATAFVWFLHHWNLLGWRY